MYKAQKTFGVDIWVSKQSDTLADKRDVYLYQAPYARH
ncbi:hypothetical protein C427_1130 [Paraglaciecola psychrophila 170]|uniref:Uncharacterized protein n=1 Tax=Paraglaciecola psychrophila 170 TaxID=1129794 RepID=K6ZLX7_9ALTE|nr:hypothetical protein C427_1130 [Paraglaciecola psychrophila 170]GAC36971.1 hypothetical protein GPSY_1336 [Paraglaciecola psychrophila 170]